MKQGKERPVIVSSDAENGKPDSTIDKIKVELEVNLSLNKHVCIVAMALQEWELQIQEVGLELSERITSLDIKSVENLETIGKLEQELKVLNVHVVYMVCLLMIINRIKSPSYQITKSG